MSKTESKGHMANLRHELLEDIAAHATNVLTEYGVNVELADQAAVAIIDHLVEHWGGQLITFPKDFFFRMAKRDQEIYDRFTGHNYAELAKEYGITQRAVYKVISRVKKRVIREIQPDLFEGS